MRIMQARWWLLKIAVFCLLFIQSTSTSSIANETEGRKTNQLHDRFGSWLIAAAATFRWHIRYMEASHGQPRQKKRPSRTQWETCHCSSEEIAQGYGTGQSSPCQVPWMGFIHEKHHEIQESLPEVQHKLSRNHLFWHHRVFNGFSEGATAHCRQAAWGELTHGNNWGHWQNLSRKEALADRFNNFNIL